MDNPRQITGVAAKPRLAELGDRWLDCSLIFSQGDVSSRLPDAAITALRDYLNRYPEGRDVNIWWDHRDRLCFSAAETRGGIGAGEFHFNDCRDRFIQRKWGTAFARRQIRGATPFEALPMRAQSEAIYGEIPALRDVKSKSVLIVLGGPSTDCVAWERLKVDAIWSCNHFYQHSTLRQLDISLVGLAPSVRLRDNRPLEAYLASHPTTSVFFELQKVYDVPFRDAMRDFVSRHPDRCAYINLRYASYLGLGSRMICIATLLGARDVYFVGFDGMSEGGPRHAFEPGKRNPTWYLRHGEDVQRRQIVIFWDYVLSLARLSDVRLYNLGERLERNGSSVIAAMQFPLPPELRKAMVSSEVTEIPKKGKPLIRPVRPDSFEVPGVQFERLGN